MKTNFRIILTFCASLVMVNLMAQNKSIRVGLNSIQLCEDKQYNCVISFLDSNKITKSINIFNLNPYNNRSEFKKLNTSLQYENFKYLITQTEFHELFGSRSNIGYKEEIIEMAKSIDTFCLRSSTVLSSGKMKDITSDNFIAIAFSLVVKPIDGKMIVGTESQVFVYNAEGEKIHEEVTDKYINSIAISDDGKYLSYSYNSEWADNRLYPSGMIIRDLDQNKLLLEKNDGGYYFVWQIKGAIGWKGMLNGQKVDYYLCNGRTIGVINNLPYGIIEIGENFCVFIKNDGSTFRKLIESDLNIYNN
jgi:hypothetical protein